MFCQLRSCALNSSGTQTSCAYVHSLSSSVHFAFYISYIGIPNCIGSSMRMAYVIPEMNAFATNITLCHR